MKSSRAMRKMFDKVVYCVPVVVLERITIPKRTENKCQQNDKSGNEEPKRKKFKTEREDSEVPQVIMSKSENLMQAKLVLLNKDIIKNPQNKDPFLSSEINTRLENFSKKITLSQKKLVLKRKSRKIIDRSTLTNSLSMGKIKVRDLHTINENIELINNEIMLFDQEKSNVSQVNNNTPLIFPLFEANELTLQYFEVLHKKYFDKRVQDSIVIINNIVFMNLLTNIHCISLINWILRWNDKRKMTQNIQFQSILHIKYVNVLDDVLRKNCIDIISNFEDSDYEHAFLMLMLSLFASLKMFGSNVFKNSNVILKKLERLQWESVKKHRHFDHNRVQMTFKSDVFCSCYHKLSKLIGEGSYTDPNIVKWWELFCSPALFKTVHFRSAINAITNSADVRKVVSLIDKASNNIRSYSHLKNCKNSSAYEKDRFEELIALVNDSARVNTSYNETIQPCTSGFDALNHINQSTFSIKDERMFITSITHTKTLKISEHNILNENFPETNLPSTSTTPTPYHTQLCHVKTTSTAAHADLFQKREPIKYKNTCTPRDNGIHTKTSRSSNFNKLNDNCPCSHLNVPAASASDFVKVHPVRNTSTPQLNTVPLVHTYLHKKFNSTIKIGNVEYRMNRTLFNQMISKSSEASVKLISSTSLNNDYTDFDNIDRENYKNDSITTRKQI